MVFVGHAIFQWEIRYALNGRAIFIIQSQCWNTVLLDIENKVFFKIESQDS
jgi:cupin superfamily acireductone dioxygenase involved in methionine salvage